MSVEAHDTIRCEIHDELTIEDTAGRCPTCGGASVCVECLALHALDHAGTAPATPVVAAPQTVPASPVLAPVAQIGRAHV